MNMVAVDKNAKLTTDGEYYSTIIDFHENILTKRQSFQEFT